MLRFFRKYIMNRSVLVAGGILLMVVFLLPSGFRRGSRGSDPVIGTIGGRKVRASQLRSAANELEILGRVHQLLAMSAARSPEQWMLMLFEARGLGLSASEDEAYRILGLFNKDKGDIERIAHERRMDPAGVIQVLRHYAMLWRYRALIYGLAQVPLHQALESGVVGYPRLSAPLARRLIYDLTTSVRITALPIHARRFEASDSVPDEHRLQELFVQYRNVPPGQGQYGIGFRLPDRVKLECLAFPLTPLLERDRSRILEAQIIEYYQQHRQEFGPPASTQPLPDRPDAQARRQIVQRLAEQQAQDLARAMIARATALMSAAANALPQKDGYYVLPADWRPPTLREIADQLQQEFSVRPEVLIYDHDWLTETGLSELAGIGQSSLTGGRVQASFAQYVLSARELNPKPDNALAVERLQAGLPSRALVDAAGNRYVFRIIEAQPQRVPATLVEVRPQVEQAARLLDAYQSLVAQREQWLRRLRSQSLEELATELNEPLLTPPPFNRLQRTASGAVQAPRVLDIPADSDFVPRVFDLAQQTASPPSTPALADAIPVDATTTVYLVRVDAFTPLPQQQYETLSQGQLLPSLVSAAMTLSLDEDPLSVEAISQRVEFKPDRPTAAETQGDDQPAPPPNGEPSTAPAS